MRVFFITHHGQALLGLEKQLVGLAMNVGVGLVGNLPKLTSALFPTA